MRILPDFAQEMRRFEKLKRLVHGLLATCFTGTCAFCAVYLQFYVRATASQLYLASRPQQAWCVTTFHPDHAPGPCLGKRSLVAPDRLAASPGRPAAAAAAAVDAAAAPAVVVAVAVAAAAVAVASQQAAPL